jgi:hypothetical protein
MSYGGEKPMNQTRTFADRHVLCRDVLEMDDSMATLGEMSENKDKRGAIREHSIAGDLKIPPMAFKHTKQSTFCKMINGGLF